MKVFLNIFYILTILIANSAYAEDQTFKDALAQAYQFNPDLKAERAKLRAGDEQIAQALSGYRPNIDLIGSLGPAYASGVDTPNGKSLTSSNAGVQVSQPLFSGFRTVAAVHQAKASIQMQRAMLKNAEQQLLLDTGTAYLDVAEEQSLISLEHESENLLQRQLEATQFRFNAGEVTKTDIDQALTRLQRTTAQRIQAEGDLANKSDNYLRLTGVSPGLFAYPTIDLGDIKDMDEAIYKAEHNNPNVIAANFSIDAAREQVNSAEGSLLPEIDLVGSVNRGQNQDLNIPGREDSGEILVQMTVPLYRSGADYARTRAAKQTVMQSRLQLQGAIDRARETIVSAWHSLITLQAAIKVYMAGIEAANAALQGVKEEARIGSRSTLDILNAQQELLDAKITLVRAQHDEGVAKLKIRASVGMLTAEALNLSVTIYQPEKNYETVQDKWFGIGDDMDK